MQIEKIINKNGAVLMLRFSNQEIRKVDYTKDLKDWAKSKNKDLKEVAKNFNTVFVEDGNLCFKISRGIAHFDSDIVFKESKAIQTIPAKNNLGVISSHDVMKTNVKGLPFTGDWKEFLGEPAKNFFMILSAQPGHGKSTFCLKFANYLTKFGRVLYITNEEDAERIKRKFEFLKDPIKNFDISFEANTFKQVIDLLKRGKYNFVFIDSAQYGGMDFKELREIRKQFPNDALIAISRQTKNGTTRGSQEKEYDGDITIKFYQQGHARTVKNRFNELAEYVLFDSNLDNDNDKFLKERKK